MGADVDVGLGCLGILGIGHYLRKHDDGLRVFGSDIGIWGSVEYKTGEMVEYPGIRVFPDLGLRWMSTTLDSVPGR